MACPRRYARSIVLLIVLSSASATWADNGLAHEDSVWNLRVAASDHAAALAETACAWAPASKRTFADARNVDQPLADRALYERIMDMLRRDQNARAIRDAFQHDTGAMRAWSNDQLGTVDGGNLLLLKQIMSEHGFPTSEAVGLDGVNAMLMLVAHADSDPGFQKRVLVEMDAKVASGVIPAHLAMMLRTIRPRLDDDRGPAATVEGEASQKRERSPRDCYNRVYAEQIDEYIRKQYAVPR